MACGLPVVASPVGVNKEIVIDGDNGFTATTEDEWVAALTLLRDDHRLRSGMGCKGRVRVEESYSLQVAAPRFASLLVSAAKKH
jgi:glycosyltransferase involved in cell wall biosynthesis